MARDERLEFHGPENGNIGETVLGVLQQMRDHLRQRFNVSSASNKAVIEDAERGIARAERLIQSVDRRKDNDVMRLP